MEKFTVEQYQEAKIVAKELGINFVGKKKEVLVDLVNAEIEKQQVTKVVNTTTKEKTTKWYSDGYTYEKDQVVEIVAKTVVKNGETKDILKGRKAQVLGPSANEGMIKAILIDDKTGELQNCPITLEISKVFLVEEKAKQEVA